MDTCMVYYEPFKAQSLSCVPPYLPRRILRSAHIVHFRGISKQLLFPYAVLSDWVIGAFVELRKAIIRFFIYVGSSACPYGTARLSLEVCS